MTDRILTTRELNRATLARQMLLERESIPILAAVERLIGLQAQVPNPPYIGLWTRLREFQRTDLTELMQQRQIVRAAMMRSTLHLMTADDYCRFRPTIQPALVRALNAFFGKRVQGLELEQLVTAARAYVEAEPRTNGVLGNLLTQIAPERDPNALAYAVRSYLPLVQLPPGGTWGSGSSATYSTAEAWLGQPLATEDHLPALVRRYLAAFGPATIMDIQAWSGMTKLKEAIEPLKPELRSFRDAQGKELLDLPDMPLPPTTTPVPPRFLPEYDNLLLAHADRTRIIADADRPRVFLSAGRVCATFLVDGFVQGTWKIKREKQTATLMLEPFVPLIPAEREALEQEGARLVRFVEDDAQHFNIMLTLHAEDQ